MGLGAMFGALNTMYSAVSARWTEIATLRAIGFGGGAVMVSVLAESLALALAGALIGAGAAWLAFNGNLHALGGSVITLAVTPGLMWMACSLRVSWDLSAAFFRRCARRGGRWPKLCGRPDDR
jgi:putative ABC transport system permease protein